MLMDKIALGPEISVGEIKTVQNWFPTCSTNCTKDKKEAATFIPNKQTQISKRDDLLEIICRNY